jgi:hypothetical protein
LGIDSLEKLGEVVVERPDETHIDISRDDVKYRLRMLDDLDHGNPRR